MPRQEGHTERYTPSHRFRPRLPRVDTLSAHTRSLLGVGQAARDTADLARHIAAGINTPHEPGERVALARKLRLLALQTLDLIVVNELLAGASFEDVAGWLAMPVADVRARYEAPVRRWRTGEPVTDPTEALTDLTHNYRFDADPVGTAMALDQWFARHADPWDDPRDPDEPGPATLLLES